MSTLQWTANISHIHLNLNIVKELIDKFLNKIEPLEYYVLKHKCFLFKIQIESAINYLKRDNINITDEYKFIYLYIIIYNIWIIKYNLNTLYTEVIYLTYKNVKNSIFNDFYTTLNECSVLILKQLNIEASENNEIFYYSTFINYINAIKTINETTEKYKFIDIYALNILTNTAKLKDYEHHFDTYAECMTALKNEQIKMNTYTKSVPHPIPLTVEYKEKYKAYITLLEETFTKAYEYYCNKLNIIKSNNDYLESLIFDTTTNITKLIYTKTDITIAQAYLELLNNIKENNKNFIKKYNTFYEKRNTTLMKEYNIFYNEFKSIVDKQRNNRNTFQPVKFDILYSKQNINDFNELILHQLKLHKTIKPYLITTENKTNNFILSFNEIYDNKIKCDIISEAFISSFKNEKTKKTETSFKQIGIQNPNLIGYLDYFNIDNSLLLKIIVNFYSYRFFFILLTSIIIILIIIIINYYTIYKELTFFEKQIIEKEHNSEKTALENYIRRKVTDLKSQTIDDLKKKGIDLKSETIDDLKKKGTDLKTETTDDLKTQATDLETDIIDDLKTQATNFKNYFNKIENFYNSHKLLFKNTDQPYKQSIHQMLNAFYSSSV